MSNFIRCDQCGKDSTLNHAITGSSWFEGEYFRLELFDINKHWGVYDFCCVECLAAFLEKKKRMPVSQWRRGIEKVPVIIVEEKYT